MPDAFTPLVTVPQHVELRDAAAWLRANVPAPVTGKSKLILFDGREASDDDVGVRQFLSALNLFLRTRADLLFCWPTTDASWHQKLHKIAENIGGENFSPAEAQYEVKGPGVQDWSTVLERLLLQYTKTLEDVGMSKHLVDEFSSKSRTVGDFLTKISSAISERVTRQQEIKGLPELLFVITSSGDVAGEANRIRRAGKQVLAPEPLLAYSPRSEAGKWWTERSKDPNHHLGYVISLFNANLITMSASAVVHACVLCGADDLKKAAKSVQANSGSASQAVKASEFYRFLSGAAVTEFTTGRKGRAKDQTVAAYTTIQALSAKRHKAINQAICALTKQYVEDFDCHESKGFEVASGGDLFTDAVIANGNRQYHTEFHHLSEAQCKAANMSSYIMGKLRTYAIYHQLVPR
jgi:hypothetical protein